MQIVTTAMLGILIVFALTFGIGIAFPSFVSADSPFKDNPSDDNNGSGNDPNGHAPGQTNNPNPSK